jgi:hypothetical protein
MIMNPPGHIPGFHIPGTVVPIGAVVAQQQAQMIQMEIAREQENRRNHLLLLRR